MWLVWLAGQMQGESRSEFLIEEMQPSLLKSKIHQAIYNLLVWGTIQMLLFWLNFGLVRTIKSLILNAGRLLVKKLIFIITFGLIFGCIRGMISGLMNSVFGTLIEEVLENSSLIKPNTFFNKTIIKWIIFGLVTGLISGLAIAVAPNLNISPNFMVLTGVSSGLISGLIGDRIEAIETLKFSYNKFKNALIYGLFYGLMYGLLFGLTRITVFSQIAGFPLSLSEGLFFGLFFGLIFGFHSIEIENKTIPNQGIWQSAKNTIKLSVFLFLPSVVLTFLFLVIIKSNNTIELLIISLMYGLFLGFLLGILRSGTPVIKHFTLRLVLYFNGYIPWNYARFLDYCTERMLLQRVGGRYRFIHKLLQDHFAQMEFRRD
nr:hypothetical protein [Nostoc sp. ChiSLP01]